MSDKLVPIPFMSGVNLFDSPKRLREGEVPYAMNLYPETPGVLSSRRSCGYMGEYVGYLNTGVVGVGWSVGSLALHPDPSVANYCYTVHSHFKDYFLMVGAGGAEVAYQRLGSTNDVPRHPVLVPYQRKLYCFDGNHGRGVGGGYVVEANTPAGTAPATLPGYPHKISPFTFAGTNNAFSPAGACVIRNRFVYWDLGPGYESHILWSDAFTPGTVGNEARTDYALHIPGGDGRIVTVIELSQTSVGSPSTLVILVLKENAGFIITGEPAETDAAPGTDIFQNVEVNRISYDVGCASHNTMCRTPYGLIWAGTDDVWSFATGSLPIRIGTKLRPTLLDAPATQKWQWFATYYKGAYRLAVHGNTNTEYLPDDARPQVRMRDQWWLDLRGGLPQNHEVATWWGPQIYYPMSVEDNLVIGIDEPSTIPIIGPVSFWDRLGFSCSAAVVVNGEQRLLAIEALMVTDATPPIYVALDLDCPNLWDSGAYYRPATNALESVPAAIGTGQLGYYPHTIVTELRTPEIEFGDPMLKKLWRGAEVRLFITGTDTSILEVPSTLSLFHTILTEGGIATTGELVAALTQSGFTFGTVLPSNLSNQFQSVLLPYSATRLLGRYFQLILKTTGRGKVEYADLTIRARIIPRRLT